mmetsp:Transcript_45531/g.105537  ORF Transcript_45531/g.105537 Transcript_45531/m.105537 type:complete len:162 (+) Transcript_45531:56-541(+)
MRIARWPWAFGLFLALVIDQGLLVEARDDEDEDGPIDDRDGEMDEDDLMGDMDGDTEMYNMDGEANVEEDHPVLKYKEAQDCISRAEALEMEVGLLDSPATTDQRLKMAEVFAVMAEELTKKRSPTFQQMFEVKLQEASKTGDGFGAYDACEFILDHHDEL